MKPIPSDILAAFNAILNRRNVPHFFRSDYRKWLLYFLDFRVKYHLSESKADQVRMFADKLRSKNQASAQIEQASDAISLFFALQAGNITVSPSAAGASKGGAGYFWKFAESKRSDDRVSRSPEKTPDMVCESPGGLQVQPPVRSGRRYDEWRCLRKTESPAWDTVIQKLAEE